MEYDHSRLRCDRPERTGIDARTPPTSGRDGALRTGRTRNQREITTAGRETSIKSSQVKSVKSNSNHGYTLNFIDVRPTAVIRADTRTRFRPQIIPSRGRHGLRTGHSSCVTPLCPFFHPGSVTRQSSPRTCFNDLAFEPILIHGCAPPASLHAIRRTAPGQVSESQSQVRRITAGARMIDAFFPTLLPTCPTDPSAHRPSSHRSDRHCPPPSMGLRWHEGLFA